MEANMSGLKRRLNKAMLECRSQARFTARRLVGHIRTIDRRAQTQQHLPTVAQQPALRVHLRHRAFGESRARQFKYSFAPAIGGRECAADSDDREDVAQEDESQDRLERIVNNQTDGRNYQRTYLANSGLMRAHQVNTKHHNTATLIDEQQVEEGFVSEEDEEGQSLSLTPTVVIKSSPIRTLETIKSKQVQAEKRMAGNQKTLAVNKSSHQQPFVRCGSRRRSSSRRRRSARGNRQVRFQPIPQAINISNHDESGDSIQAEQNGHDHNGQQEEKVADEMPKFIATSVKKYQRRVHLSAKPLTKKLHQLSHVKFNKIKLKSFNSLAHQIHQTLATSSFAPTSMNSSKMMPNLYSSSSSSTAAAAAPTSDYRDHIHQQRQSASETDNFQSINNNTTDDDFGWGSDFDEQSLDSSLASQCDKSQTEGSSYLLEMGKSSCDFRAIKDVIQDQGTSGQFKQIDPNQSIANAHGQVCYKPDSPPKPPQRSHSAKQEEKVECGAGGGNRLRDELERRRQCEQMIRDSLKIVERSDSDKESDSDRSHHQAAEADNDHQQLDLQASDRGELEGENHNEEIIDGSDEDEESLRSLEARQGFRQIRDKLKIILDQRLANYERSLSDGAGGAALQQATKPNSASNLEIRPIQSSSAQVNNCGSMSQVSSRKEPVLPAVRPADIHPGKTSSGREFDCQSHCSDESGSSSGLDSNHSGSQDSGHSTQHSGYSSHSCAHHRHLSPSIETSSPTNSSPSAQLESPSLPKVLEEAPTAARGDLQHQETDEVIRLISEESEERRNRFVQNRQIINSKLESMFSKRSPRGRPQSNSNANSSTDYSPQKYNTISASRPLIADIIPPAAVSVADPETRRRLLEEQRQMSLKLKQKPRRKSAKRLFNPPQVSANNQSDQTTENNQSYSSGLNRCGSIRRQRIGRDSLTKQLSMICLRQAGQIMREAPVQNDQQQQVMQSASCVYSGGKPTRVAPDGRHEPGNGERLPRAAQSLRQLVKDVIDDCERPSKLSPLTMSILNRSDSLSSDLANSADEAHSSMEHSNLSSSTLNDEGGRSSSSLGSLKAADRTREAEQQQQSDTHLNRSNYHCNQHLSPPIGYIYPIQHSTPQQLSLQLADRSLSSVGTIDGLEYSRASSGDMDLAANERLQSQQVDAQLAQEQARLQRPTIGSYLKSLRDFSRVKLAKVKLMNNGSGADGGLAERKQHQQQLQFDTEHQSLGASKQHLNYLNNSRNFTDEDLY